jgi:predicted GIY-YIG superfamily endonuclease
MRFFVYMLKFPTGLLYTGSTGNFPRRMRAHAKVRGMNGALVLKEAFETREEALKREKQLKGWTRAKKEALIKMNLEKLIILSKRRGGDSYQAPTSAESLA